MDFSWNEHQEALRALSRKILEDHATPERLRALETGTEWYDQTLWAALAQAELLGLALPPEVGGSGMGLLELCILLEQVGRTVAPVPVLPTLVMGALPIAAFGTEEQQQRILPNVAAGSHFLTAALVEPDSDRPTHPLCIARPEGDGWRLFGTKSCIPAAHLAGHILVPARTPGGVGVFLLEMAPHEASNELLASRGITLERQIATNGSPEGLLVLDGTFVPAQDVLGDAAEGALVVEWILERTLAGLCAIELGVASRALELTAAYTTGRQQFDRPIATFQAVAQRAADAYIDLDAIKLTGLKAAWRLSEGLPSAQEVAVAKFWAAEGGHRVVYAAQHLHGGIGVDLDYPLHRYYLWSRHIELTLGGAHRQLTHLGASLALPQPQSAV